MTNEEIDDKAWLGLQRNLIGVCKALEGSVAVPFYLNTRLGTPTPAYTYVPNNDRHVGGIYVGNPLDGKELDGFCVSMSDGKITAVRPSLATLTYVISRSDPPQLIRDFAVEYLRAAKQILEPVLLSDSRL